MPGISKMEDVDVYVVEDSVKLNAGGGRYLLRLFLPRLVRGALLLDESSAVMVDSMVHLSLPKREENAKLIGISSASVSHLLYPEEEEEAERAGSSSSAAQVMVTTDDGPLDTLTLPPDAACSSVVFPSLGLVRPRPLASVSRKARDVTNAEVDEATRWQQQPSSSAGSAAAVPSILLLANSEPATSSSAPRSIAEIQAEAEAAEFSADAVGWDADESLTAYESQSGAGFGLGSILPFTPWWHPTHAADPTLSQSDFSALLEIRRADDRPLWRVDGRLALLQIVDMLLAYAYEVRVTLADFSSESAFNIRKVSSLLSWLRTPCSVNEAVHLFARRVILHGIMRRLEVAAAAIADVAAILRHGRTALLKATLEMKRAFDLSDTEHVWSRAYLEDFCLAVQQPTLIGDEVIEAAARDLAAVPPLTTLTALGLPEVDATASD